MKILGSRGSYMKSLILLVILVCNVSLIFPQRSWAQDPDGRKPPDDSGIGSIGGSPDPSTRRSGDLLETRGDLVRLAEQSKTCDGPVTLIIELDQPPATQVAAGQAMSQAENEAAVLAQSSRVAVSQQQVLDQMTTANLSYRTIFSPKLVFSGLVVETTCAEMNLIKQIPGVADVYQAGIGILENSSSVPFLGTSDVWRDGNTGRDIKVGVIDTGIDYEHADFGGLGPGTVFPTAKVAGGYDFVGDNWDPFTSPALVPDPDPMDPNNHGTHMAGTIAGYGVDVSGNTYTGPWDNTTPFTTMTIGPGMAPEATLYALKVGDESQFVSEAATIAALEWAIDPNGDGDFSDRLDIVNLSLGRDFGDPDRGWSLAANNAAQAGVIVVAAATNSDDVYFIQGDPATADWVISAGSSNDGDNGGPAADLLSVFSPRGPQRGSDPAGLALKPDIIAPGDAIRSADAGTYNGWLEGNGTSSASAHVSGMMALLRQEYPGWSVAELKALIMNTAIHDLYSGPSMAPPIYGPARAGAGRLDAANAMNSDVIAFNAADPELVSVSFGIINAVTSTTLRKEIVVRNMGTQLLGYDVDYVPVVYADDADGGATPGIGNGGPGVTMSVSPAHVDLGPGETTTLEVTLQIEPSLMTRPFTHDATVRELYPIWYRYWLAEESGYVTLTPTVSTPGSTDLRVPVFAAPRPAATMTAVTDVIPVSGTTGTTSIDLAGTDVFTGPTVPYDENSLVSAFELQLASPDDSLSQGIVNSADLEFVGVGNTYRLRGNDLNITELFFGFTTYGEWSSLSNDVQFEVYIDPDQDGVANYVLWNGNIWGDFSGNWPSDELYVFFDDLSTPTGIDQVVGFVNRYAPIASAYFPNTVAFQNNVVFLPFIVNQVPEFTAGNSQFDFWVASFYKDEWVDVTEAITYDIEAAGLDLYSGPSFWSPPLFDDWDGTSIDIFYDWSQYTGPNPPCILLLHHHNIPGMRAETVCLQTDVTSDLAIEKSVSDAFPEPGDTIIYTITAVNNSQSASPVAIVDDTLPDGVTYVSHIASQGNYSPFSGQWTVGSLSPSGSLGDRATLMITATVDANASGEITNTATISPNVGVDITPANNSAQATINLNEFVPDFSLFDPAISKRGELQAGGIGLPGEQIMWTITVTNEGAAPGIDFQIVDMIRPELRVDDADTDRGTVTIDGNTVTFTIDYLAPGESVQMRIYTTVLTVPEDGIFTNEVAVVGYDGARAGAEVTGIGMLPSTGYPPVSQSRPTPWLLAGLSMLVLGMAVIAAYRRINA